MPYVIAEIGFNHGGDAGLAVKMIEAAAGAGADAVKFQSFYASDIYFPDHELYPVFKAGELSEQDHALLKKAADSLGVDFISTPFSPRWVEALERLEPAGYKIASMDINNPVLQKSIAEKGRGVYVSTGASDMSEVKSCVDRLGRWGAGRICVFHCVSNYPTKPEDAMLYMIPRLKSEGFARVGFSDHTLGTTVPIAALALGAEVVEKHFTIDKNLPGPDHKLSADPAELKKLVDALKAAESAVAEPGEKKETRADAECKHSMRRGIWAARDIEQGEIITLESLNLVRPEVAPLENLEKVLDKPAQRSFRRRDPVTP